MCPHNNLCYEAQSVEANYIAGTPYVGQNVRMYAGPGGHRGEFSAWDPVAAKTVWTVKEMFPAWSGAVVTAGDVVFYGTMDGWFRALDAKTGDEVMGVQSRFGHHFAAHHVQRTRRKTICRRSFGCRRMGGRHRRRNAERQRTVQVLWAF